MLGSANGGHCCAIEMIHPNHHYALVCWAVPTGRPAKAEEEHKAIKHSSRGTEASALGASSLTPQGTRAACPSAQAPPKAAGALRVQPPQPPLVCVHEAPAQQGAHSQRRAANGPSLHSVQWRSFAVASGSAAACGCTCRTSVTDIDIQTLGGLDGAAG